MNKTIMELLYDANEQGRANKWLVGVVEATKPGAATEYVLVFDDEEPDTESDY